MTFALDLLLTIVFGAFFAVAMKLDLREIAIMIVGVGIALALTCWMG